MNNTIKFKIKPLLNYAPSLKEAHARGLYQCSMSRDELMARVTKYNPMLRWVMTEHTAALVDSYKGFICGITRTRTIPMFSIMQKQDEKLAIARDKDDGKMLARGWPVILMFIKSKGYKIDEENLTDDLFWDIKVKNYEY